MYYLTNYYSPLGNITLMSDGDNLIGLCLEGQEKFYKNNPDNFILNDDLSVFALAKKWLDKYFNDEKPSISDVPLMPLGNEFRKNVWKLLCEIPYGEVATYGSIARKIAIFQGKEKMSAQAVGGAVGNNPISIIIPCHRVIGANGNLTGYSGGLDKKIKLLQLEGIDINKFNLKNI